MGRIMRTAKTWTILDDIFLIENKNNGIGFLMRHMRRGEKTIKNRALELRINIGHAKTKKWDEWEIDILWEFAYLGVYVLMEKLPHRSRFSIQAMAQKLGIKIELTKPRVEIETNRPPTDKTAYFVRMDISSMIKCGKTIEHAIARCAVGFGRTIEQITDFLENPKYDKQVEYIASLPNCG